MLSQNEWKNVSKIWYDVIADQCYMHALFTYVVFVVVLFFKVSFLSLFTLNFLGSQGLDLGFKLALDLTFSLSLGTFSWLLESLLDSACLCLDLGVNLSRSGGCDGSLSSHSGILLLNSKE